MERKRPVCWILIWPCCAFLAGLITGCNSSSPSAPITVAVTPQVAAVGTGQTAQFTAMVSDMSGVTWSASAGTVDSGGNFTAPSGSTSMTVTLTATSAKDTTKTASATVNVVAPGTVSSTANPQVASYVISPAAVGNVSVQFGTDTNYGLTTWT